MVVDISREIAERARPILGTREWLKQFDRDVDAYRPATDVGRLLKRLMQNPELGLDDQIELLDIAQRIIVAQSCLEATVYRGLDGVPWLHPGHEGYSFARAAELGTSSYHPLLTPRDPLWWKLIERHGIVSRKVITNAGIDFLVGAFTASQTISNMKFHGIGTGTGAEAATETALGTELTTEYNPNSTRATGSQSAVTAPNPDQYQTVGTNTLDSGTPAVTEHGVFSASSAGTLWDRSLFSAINLVGANGDGLQTTYTLTLNAGG